MIYSKILIVKRGITRVKKTINDLMSMKNDQKITMITAYDYYMGKLVDEAGIDVVLVGDSLGMVVQGHDDTLPVELEEMIYHTKAVTRGVEKALIVTDLPFMSYQSGVIKALKSAGRIMKKSRAGAVKLEGGKRVVPQVKALVETGIPVMGHIGLTPQSVNQFGGFKVQGKDKSRALELLEDALALQEAGAFSIVLETVPCELACIVTDKLSIPTIGIGAGLGCDGQVLVLHDLLGVDKDFKPKFVRRYADLNQVVNRAVAEYIQDVRNKKFPANEESFEMKSDILIEIEEELADGHY